MNPLRIFLLVLSIILLFSVDNAEADDWELSLENTNMLDKNNFFEQCNRPPNRDCAFIDAIVSGNYLYVTAYGTEGGLFIIDIEEPTNPTLIGTYEDFYGDIAISGNYVYLLSSNLSIIDVEDPSNPTLAGILDNEGGCSIAISGNYAYLHTPHSSFITVDIEDPSNPDTVGQVDEQIDPVDSNACSVDISGNYAYVTGSSSGADSGLHIVDIADPFNPTLIGSYEPDDTLLSVAISGNYAYVTGSFYDLHVLDVGDPTNPSLAGRCNTTFQSNDIAVIGNYAYLVKDVNGGQDALFMVDIEDPFNPTFTGSYLRSSSIGEGYGIAVSGDYVYVTGKRGLAILESGFKPHAIIDLISPSPVRFSDEISFSGSGEDYDGTIVKYEWMSSLDGFLSNEEDFSITALSVGDHNISFRVLDNSGRWSYNDSVILVVNSNDRPSAEINLSSVPSQAEEGTTLFFNGTGLDSDGTIVVYLWQSSIDGFLSNDEGFSTSVLSRGKHIIYFQVQDNDGDWSSDSQFELLIYTLPRAIAGQNSTGTPGVPLQFSGAGAHENGTIVKYEWDFDGDGIFEWSSTENGLTTYIYNNEDTYTATLRVTDNEGFTDMDTVEITISEKKIVLNEDDNTEVTVSDAKENEEGIPSLSFIPAFTMIGLIAIFRRK